MYILIITLFSTVGIYHPLVLKGEPPTTYRSYGECLDAAEKVVDWLQQDFIKVQYECRKEPS